MLRRLSDNDLDGADDTVKVVMLTGRAMAGFIRWKGTVQNRGTHENDTSEGRKSLSGVQRQSPGKGPRVVDTIFVSNCSTYCLLQIITFVQTY